MRPRLVTLWTIRSTLGSEAETTLSSPTTADLGRIHTRPSSCEIAKVPRGRRLRRRSSNYGSQKPLQSRYEQAKPWKGHTDAGEIIVEKKRSGSLRRSVGSE